MRALIFMILLFAVSCTADEPLIDVTPTITDFKVEVSEGRAEFWFNAPPQEYEMGVEHNGELSNIFTIPVSPSGEYHGVIGGCIDGVWTFYIIGFEDETTHTVYL